MPASGISERNFPYLNEQLQAKEYHVFLPGAFESQMKYSPGHIYMGGLLRQPEFDIFHTDRDRVRAIVSMKGE